jgi:hypothetical protein
MLKEFKFLTNPLDRVFYFTAGFNRVNLALLYFGQMDENSIYAMINHIQMEYNGFIIGNLIRIKMECEMNEHLQGISVISIL